jgi:hypothetical protein
MSNGNLSSNVNIVNYLPNLPVTIINTSSELHHQQNHQYIKKCDSNFIQQSKEQQSHMIHIYGDSNIIQSDLPVLTPLKYMEYQNNLNSIVSSAGTDEQQILMTHEDVMSEKSDCESIHELPLKNSSKQSLPHKKRIAKKLNSDEFSIILSDPDANIRTLQATNVSLTSYSTFQLK